MQKKKGSRQKKKKLDGFLFILIVLVLILAITNGFINEKPLLYATVILAVIILISTIVSLFIK